MAQTQQVATIKMAFERETKGTVLYKEQGANARHNLYIAKDKLPQPFPNNITVTITAD